LYDLPFGRSDVMWWAVSDLRPESWTVLSWKIPVRSEGQDTE
jgi:hypothetical protein